MKSSVTVFKDGMAGRIRFNHSSEPLAISKQSCASIEAALLGWLNDDHVQLVILDHDDSWAGFSSGADLEFLASVGPDHLNEGSKYLEALYRLTQLIAKYPKPCVTILNGVVSGSAVGMACASTYRVATEKTLLSLPETGIGFAPHGGTSWYLPKLSGEIGTWLALTGSRLVGEDVLATGLATHFVSSADLVSTKELLCSFGTLGLRELSDSARLSLQDCVEEIETAFAGDRAEAIQKRLEKGSDWAKSQATKLIAKSPISTKISLRLMRTGRYLSSINSALRLEYRIATRLIQTANFREGVRAGLRDKDHCPDWQPAIIRSVNFDAVSGFFAPFLDPFEELALAEFDQNKTEKFMRDPLLLAVG